MLDLDGLSLQPGFKVFFKYVLILKEADFTNSELLPKYKLNNVLLQILTMVAPQSKEAG